MSRYDLVGNSYLGAEEVRSLLGAWQDIVGRRAPAGWANPGGHGAYGGGQGYVPPHLQQQFQQPGIPPRNALVDRQGPGRADRILLPMSSSGLVTASATITARPQNVAYRPERIIIGGTPADWTINDIKVGNRSQLSQAGELPGEAFANTAIDTFVSMETVQTAMDFVMQVTFIGTASAGAQFKAAVFGTAAIGG
jgi:hypothetical protein